MDICRICCKNAGTSGIFDKNHEVPISAKIMYCCANIHISEQDGLPAHLCRSCEQDLAFAYQFILKCEASDKKLRTLFAIPAEPDNRHDQDTKVGDNIIYELDKHLTWASYKGESENTVVSEYIKTIKNAKKQRKCKVVDPQKCGSCDFQCKHPSTLVIHMRKHSEHRGFACSSCDKKYKDNAGLKRHIERNHNPLERKRKFVCETCGKSFYSQGDVKIHMRTHTGETPYACGTCPMKFTQIGTLIRHQRRHAGNRIYNCLKCNKTFLTKADVRRHQVAHSTEKKYICTTCNIPFKYQNNLRKHMRAHSQKNHFVCNDCGRTFNAKGNLKIHIDNMHSEKSGFCAICLKFFPNLEVHMWRHNGKRALQCELCSSSFFDKKALTRHMNVRHKYNNKHKCSVEKCKVTFPSQSMLEFHVAKYHRSQIPFPCDGCSKGFYRKSDLCRHKLRIHREKLDFSVGNVSC